jgi:tetratricopeptide (TPR) repeat protein
MKSGSLISLRALAFLFMVTLSADSHADVLSKEELAEANRIGAKIAESMQDPAGEDKVKGLTPAEISLLKRASAENPNDAKLHHSLFVYYLATLEKKDALKESEAAHSLSPQNDKYLMMYILALKMNWQPIKARDVMAAYSAKLGKPLQIETMVGTLDLPIQDYAPAAAVFEKWLREANVNNPKERTTVLHQLGICYLYLGRTDDAITTFTKAIDEFPGNVLSKRERFVALVKANRLEPAIALFDREVKTHEDAKVLYYDGVALEKLGRSGETKQIFEQALSVGEKRLKVGDDMGEDHFYLSLVCGKLGLEEKAQSYRSNATVLHFTFEPPYSTNAVKSPDVRK